MNYYLKHLSGSPDKTTECYSRTIKFQKVAQQPIIPKTPTYTLYPTNNVNAPNNWCIDESRSNIFIVVQAVNYIIF